MRPEIFDTVLRRIIKDATLRLIFRNAIYLFLKGKLFRNLHFVFKQWFKGVSLVLALLLPIGYFVNPLTGVIIASLVGGAAQPWLYRDIKYR